MVTTTICTLTIKDDYRGEYEDDLLHRRDSGRHVEGALGTSRLTRDVVTLLHRWVANYPQCRRDELMLLGKALYEIAFGTDVRGPPDAPMRAAFEETLRLCREENRTFGCASCCGPKPTSSLRIPGSSSTWRRGPTRGSSSLERTPG